MKANMLQRPLLGGPFGDGRYSLATLPTVANGLHCVRYLVLEASGTVLATGEDKLKVIAEARRVLHLLVVPASNDALWHQQQLWPDMAPGGKRTRPASRRRREVLERSGYACFYCRVPLTVDAFHVEHQQPRALGGTDDPLNLVAACSACNLAKGPRTAIEHIASGGKT